MKTLNSMADKNYNDDRKEFGIATVGQEPEIQCSQVHDILLCVRESRIGLTVMITSISITVVHKNFPFFFLSFM